MSVNRTIDGSPDSSERKTNSPVRHERHAYNPKLKNITLTLCE